MSMALGALLVEFVRLAVKRRRRFRRLALTVLRATGLPWWATITQRSSLCSNTLSAATVPPKPSSASRFSVQATQATDPQT